MYLGEELPEVVVTAERKEYTLYTQKQCTDAGAKAVKEGDKYKCMCGKYVLNLMHNKCEKGEPIDISLQSSVVKLKVNEIKAPDIDMSKLLRIGNK